MFVLHTLRFYVGGGRYARVERVNNDHLSITVEEYGRLREPNPLEKRLIDRIIAAFAIETASLPSQENYRE